MPRCPAGVRCWTRTRHSHRAARSSVQSAKYLVRELAATCRYLTKAFSAGLTSRGPLDARYGPAEPIPDYCRDPTVWAGCITFFTTYSPILSPIFVPTRVEKR